MGGASDEEKEQIEDTFQNYKYNYDISLEKLEDLQKEISENQSNHNLKLPNIELF